MNGGRCIWIYLLLGVSKIRLMLVVSVKVTLAGRRGSYYFISNRNNIDYYIISNSSRACVC